MQISPISSAAAFFLLHALFLAGAPGQAASNIAPPPRAPSTLFSPNYAHGAGMKALNRWRKLPVRVYVETGQAYTGERREQALAGFDRWTEATEGKVNYTLVNTARQADVTVRFLPGSFVGNDPHTIGRTLIGFWGGYMRQARMELATGSTDADQLTETAAHEWGHALGLNGHSEDPDDLMYAHTIRYILPPDFPIPRRAIRRPTTRDINTLKTAYKDIFATNPTTSNPRG